MNEHIASQKPHAHLFFYVPMYTQIENTIKKLDPKTKAAEIMKLKKTDISGLIKELNIARRYHKSIHQESYKVARELVTPQEITDIINSIESDEEINKRFDLKYSYLRDTNSAAYAEEYVVKEKIDKTLLEKTDLLKKLQKQYRPQGEKLFTVHNAASADAKTIRDLDELNQNRIYGPTGYGLLRYTISESQNAIDVYKQNIQNLLEEMPQQDFKLLKNFDERVLYCNNIRKMKDIFADSQFPIELAYDFSVTNLPLIHNLYEKHFILEDERFEMRSQVFSALYAKALIDKYKDADDMQIDTIQDLRTASKVLEYSEKAKVCRYERTKKIGHHKDSHRKYKKVCWDEARKALPKGSIGREMIKLIEIEEKALQLQRSYNEYCRGDAAENLNPLHIKETSSEKEESAPAEVAQ